jgi:hypothetical protein
MKTYTNRIENLVSTWNSINSIEDWRKWVSNVRAEKFGTYGTISIFDVIKNTEYKFASSWIKDSFLNEVKEALSDENAL